MQTLANLHLMVSMTAHTCPGWTNYPCNVFFFFLSLAKQVALLGSFLAAFDWLHIQVGQRWQCVLSAWSMTLLWQHCPWPLIGLLGQLLIVCMHICVWRRQRRPLMWSQEAGGQEIQPDCVNNLWQVTFKGKKEYIKDDTTNIQFYFSHILVFLMFIPVVPLYATSFGFYKPQNKQSHCMQTFFYSLTAKDLQPSIKKWKSDLWFFSLSYYFRSLKKWEAQK